MTFVNEPAEIAETLQALNELAETLQEAETLQDTDTLQDTETLHNENLWRPTLRSTD